MAGYANRTIRLDFPDLSEPGDNIHVIIRNPRLMPPAELRPDDIELDAKGEPVDTEAATQETFKTIAKIIIAWHVYDATSLEEDQPPLPLPATPGLVAKLPLEITNRIGEALGEAVSPPQ